jgi:hypothetical protein
MLAVRRAMRAKILNLRRGSRDEETFRFTTGTCCGKNGGHLSSILLPCFLSCGYADRCGREPIAELGRLS